MNPAPTLPVEDRYDYVRGTILAVIQFRPSLDGDDRRPREVWVSVQNGIDNKEDFPLVRFTTLAEWPQALSALLEELKQDLPRRRLLHERRKTQKPASAPTAGSARPAASPGKKPVTPAPASTKAAAAPPPVPTATSPIPKGDLAMRGLFDEL